MTRMLCQSQKLSGQESPSSQVLNVISTGAQMESINQIAGLTGAQRQNDITRAGRKMFSLARVK